MKKTKEHRTKSSESKSAKIEYRKEEIEKINRAIEDCQDTGTSKYVNANGKIYLVTPDGVMSYEGTTTVAYSQSQEHKEIAQTDKLPSFIVIGYDNLTHGKDAICRQITTQLQVVGLKNVKVFGIGELKPELSTKLSKADYAIFFHSCWMKKPEVKIAPLDACGLETAGSSIPGCGHLWDPCSLLALTNSVYGRYPQSWLIKVTGQNQETEPEFSPRIVQNIQNAVEQIEFLIKKTWRINQVKTVANPT